MFRSTASFDRLLERATSNLLLEPDWNAILAICDSIRSGDTQPKYAINAIKKKFYHENPHVVLYALTVVESCVKNCGTPMHDEVATKQFMEELREIVKHSSDENIKNKILEILQTWGMAFRNSPKYKIVTETLNLMKAEGWKFPAIREAEAMFEADSAPDWAEGDVCHRCRVAFGMMTRQHHCRACGQVFCAKCSSKFCPLPKFGFEREVRCCDSCYDLYGPTDDEAGNSGSPNRNPKIEGSSSDLPAEYLASSLSQQSQKPPSKSEAEIKEEEELQLALALSQSEAEAKEKHKLRSTSKILSSDNKPAKSTAEAANSSRSVSGPEELDPELVRYLDRDYWEQKEREKAEAKRRAGSASKSPQSPVKVDPDTTSKVRAAGGPGEERTATTMGRNNNNDAELDEFVTTLRTQVEIFVNRMKSNSSRGRSITNDSSVQTLFMNTMAMHSKLLKHIQDQEDKRVHYEGLQDKLTQVKDARAALEALREEERERKRQEAEEAERLRQVQMREKLELMRKKKQEYLQYQRQLALQRMQEQEREMLLRQEQAKQQYFMQHQQQQAVPSPYYGHPTTAGMYAQGYGPQPMDAYTMANMASALPVAAGFSGLPGGGQPMPGGPPGVQQGVPTTVPAGAHGGLAFAGGPPGIPGASPGVPATAPGGPGMPGGPVVSSAVPPGLPGAAAAIPSAVPGIPAGIRAAPGPAQAPAGGPLQTQAGYLPVQQMAGAHPTPPGGMIPPAEGMPLPSNAGTVPPVEQQQQQQQQQPPGGALAELISFD